LKETAWSSENEEIDTRGRKKKWRTANNRNRKRGGIMLIAEKVSKDQGGKSEAGK